MKEIEIELPDELYERAIKIAEKLNITFDELCNLAIEEYLAEHDSEEITNNL